MTTRRVWLTGTFDVLNYGDLLFPLIAAHRLAPHGIEIVPVAPTARRPPWQDAAAPLGVRDMLAGEAPADAVLIGGGYIIHTQSLGFLEEYQEHGVGETAGAQLWLGATLAACLHDVPVAWNAPGVLGPFSAAIRDTVVAGALATADYVSVRDAGSAEFLGDPDGAAVQIVPDTVVDLARMWPKATLAADAAVLRQRKSVPGHARLLALHLRRRSLGALDHAALAARIDAFAREHALLPVLISIGPSLFDSGLLRDVAARMTEPHVLLDDPLGLREIAAAIAHAALYIGASFHGYVTAAVYDVPGVMVARPAFRKFGGFLRQTGRMQDLARDWLPAFDAAAQALAQPSATRIPEAVLAAADAHWQAITRAIADPARRAAARQRFLRSWLRWGVERAGPGWLVEPFLTRATRHADWRPG